MNRIGLFFGYPTRRPDPNALIHCFQVELDEHPTAGLPHGQAIIGTTSFFRQNGVQIAGGFEPLQGKKGSIALDRSGPWVWHELTVKVLNNEIAVSVDKKKAEPFNIAWLEKTSPEIAGSLNPRGALGIWVSNGLGQFKEANIVAYPESDH